MFPIINGLDVPEWIGKLAYRGYAEIHGKGCQALWEKQYTIEELEKTIREVNRRMEIILKTEQQAGLRNEKTIKELSEKYEKQKKINDILTDVDYIRKIKKENKSLRSKLDCSSCGVTQVAHEHEREVKRLERENFQLTRELISILEQQKRMCNNCDHLTIKQQSIDGLTKENETLKAANRNGNKRLNKINEAMTEEL